VHVLKGAKLGQLHSNAQRLEGRQIKVPTEAGSYSSDYSFPLSETLDAGIVPANGVLEVDGSIKTIWIPRGRLQVGNLRRPILLRRNSWEEPILFCPQHLMSQFVVAVRKAVRAYAIPGYITPFRIRSDADAPGKYYLLSDLKNLAPRDIKREREERDARHKRLVDR
jgi:hypothetical protein